MLHTTRINTGLDGENYLFLCMLELVDFFLAFDNPPSGCDLRSLYFCHSKDLPVASFDEFEHAIVELEAISPSMIQTEKSRISFVSKLELEILKLQLQTGQPDPAAEAPKASTSFTVENLLGLLNTETDYDELKRRLETPTARQVLSQEYLHLTTPVKPFVEVCHNNAHCKQVSEACVFKNGQIYFPNRSLDSLKFSKCLESKIHFIPIIKGKSIGKGKNCIGSTATDTALGDCSYLDTCFKMNSSCRFIHYYKWVPQDMMKAQIALADRANQGIRDVEIVSDFCWNSSVGDNVRKQMAAQWIKCDINKLDFSILGKFSAIIADRKYFSSLRVFTDPSQLENPHADAQSELQR